MITLDIKPYKSTLSNSSTSVNFTESLPIVERYIRKTNRLNDARANYFSALEDYLYYNFMTEAPSLLRYPEQSFSYYDQSIHFNYNRAFPIFKNVSQTFNNLFHLPCTQNCDVETDLLNAITTLLSLYKTTPKHWVLKYTFETKNQCPFPINDFFTFNDTLYCWHPNATSSAIRCYCLSTPFLQTLSKNEQKYYTDCLPFLKAVKNKSILPSFVYQKSKNPFYMHVNTSKESLTITYDDNTGSFTTHAHNLKKIDYLRDSFLDARNHSILPNQDIGHLFHHLNFSAQKPDSLSPSKELVRFLMELTNRNNKTLTNLALLFANIASPEILTPKLFLLTTNAKECTCPLKEYFPFLLEHIFSPTEMPGFFIPFQTLGELTQKKHIYTMTNNLSMETKLITVEQGTSRLSDTQLSCIRKYVKGSKMSVSDKKCGSIFFRNTSPVICFVNNQKDLSFIEHNLPCIRIDLDHIEDSTCLPTRELFSSSSACEWLRLCLPLYGIYLLAEKKYHHTHLPKEVHLRSSSQEDTIIQEFINVCCTRSADVFIYTDELYNAYTFYYKTKHKSTPLKRTQFVTELKRIPNLTYKRPHFSRSEPNKYAFMGICLKTNWESSLSSSDENLSLEEEDFMKKLNKITELIPNTLTNHLKSI